MYKTRLVYTQKGTILGINCLFILFKLAVFSFGTDLIADTFKIKIEI